MSACATIAVGVRCVRGREAHIRHGGSVRRRTRTVQDRDWPVARFKHALANMALEIEPCRGLYRCTPRCVRPFVDRVIIRWTRQDPYRRVLRAGGVMRSKPTMASATPGNTISISARAACSTLPGTARRKPTARVTPAWCLAASFSELIACGGARTAANTAHRNMRPVLVPVAEFKR